jgi:hypothetical protein
MILIEYMIFIVFLFTSVTITKYLRLSGIIYKEKRFLGLTVLEAAKKFVRSLLHGKKLSMVVCACNHIEVQKHKIGSWSR